MKLKDTDIVFEKCTAEHLDDICALQESAFEHIDNPDLLRRNSREMLLSCLVEHCTLGAFYNGQLIAFAVLYDGGDTDENIGFDIGLSGDAVKDVINMKLIIVSPEYRGNGLQGKLMARLEAVAVEKGKKLICATVSPLNSFSCNNFIKSGYAFHSTKEKYGGLLRSIYVKRI